MGTQFSLLLNWNCPSENEKTLERASALLSPQAHTPRVTSHFADPSPVRASPCVLPHVTEGTSEHQR